MAKIAIVGSRKYQNKEDVERFLDLLYTEDVVISGHSPGGGVDIWAEEGAKKRGIATEIYPIDNKVVFKQGFRTAAMARNWEIVRACDALVAFWDKASTGTTHSYAAAAYLLKPLLLITADMNDANPKNQESAMRGFLMNLDE